MGRRPALDQYRDREGKTTEIASRVRDNKRRHRARQKEYVSDLERRVAETRQQGIQATKEVQLAAQRVVRENTGLRDLLGRIGYTNDSIDNWLKDHGCLDGGGRHQLMSELMSSKNAQKVPTRSELQRGEKLETQDTGAEEIQLHRKMTSESLTKTYPRSEQSHSETSDADPTMCSSTCTKVSSLSGYSDGTTAPCKLVSLLAKDPSADITQVQLSTQSGKQPCPTNTPEDCSPEGVECSTAYKILMQYATSDEKMDRIAMALESGCTQSTAGGCKVKNSVMWTVLDEECT